MAARKSGFTRGWELAKRRYPKPPESRAVPLFEPPKDLNETERESFIDGYLEWCSGKHFGKNKRPLDR